MRAGCGKAARPVRRGAGLRACSGAPRLLYRQGNFGIRVERHSESRREPVGSRKRFTFDLDQQLISCPNSSLPRELRKLFVELVVSSDPNPLDGVALAHAYRPVLVVDPHRPQIGGCPELFEPQGRVLWGFRKERISFPRSRLRLARQTGVPAPEGRPHLGNHSLAGSSGSLGPSAIASLTKASSFGRVRVSETMCSQAASLLESWAAWASSRRNRAKSIKDSTFCGGNSRQIERSSFASVDMNQTYLPGAVAASSLYKTVRQRVDQRPGAGQSR